MVLYVISDKWKQERRKIETREKTISENSLGIHVVYTRRTLELKIELRRIAKERDERAMLMHRQNKES